MIVIRTRANGFLPPELAAQFAFVQFDGDVRRDRKSGGERAHQDEMKARQTVTAGDLRHFVAAC